MNTDPIKGYSVVEKQGHQVVVFLSWYPPNILEGGVQGTILGESPDAISLAVPLANDTFMMFTFPTHNILAIQTASNSVIAELGLEAEQEVDDGE